MTTQSAAGYHAIRQLAEKCIQVGRCIQHRHGHTRLDAKLFGSGVPEYPTVMSDLPYQHALIEEVEPDRAPPCLQSAGDQTQRWPIVGCRA